MKKIKGGMRRLSLQERRIAANGLGVQFWKMENA